ncbi:MAG: cell division protein ZapA [Ignavibacteria bacterium]|nr:cell division protein ZapA [Ignavibacteria bacterium]
MRGSSTPTDYGRRTYGPCSALGQCSKPRGAIARDFLTYGSTTNHFTPTHHVESDQVTIGGKDLTLRGNDEEKIKRSVREVNLQVQHLQQTLREQSTPTLTVLAALNIAGDTSMCRTRVRRTSSL